MPSMLNCASCLFLLSSEARRPWRAVRVAVRCRCACTSKTPMRMASFIGPTTCASLAAAVASLGPQLIGNLAHGHCGSTPQIFGMQRAHGMKYSVPATMGDACTVELTPLDLTRRGPWLSRRHWCVITMALSCVLADCRFGFVAAQTGMPCEVWPLEESDSFERLDEPVTPRLDEESAPPAAELSPSLGTCGAASGTRRGWWRERGALNTRGGAIL